MVCLNGAVPSTHQVGDTPTGEAFGALLLPLDLSGTLLTKNLSGVT